MVMYVRMCVYSFFYIFVCVCARACDVCVVCMYWFTCVFSLALRIVVCLNLCSFTAFGLPNVVIVNRGNVWQCEDVLVGHQQGKIRPIRYPREENVCNVNNVKKNVMRIRGCSITDLNRATD